MIFGGRVVYKYSDFTGEQYEKAWTVVNEAVKLYMRHYRRLGRKAKKAYVTKEDFECAVISDMYKKLNCVLEEYSNEYVSGTVVSTESKELFEDSYSIIAESLRDGTIQEIGLLALFFMMSIRFALVQTKHVRVVCKDIELAKKMKGDMPFWVCSLKFKNKRDVSLYEYSKSDSRGADIISIDDLLKLGKK